MSGYGLFLLCALGLPLAVALARGGFSWKRWGSRIAGIVAISIVAGFGWDAYALHRGFWSLSPAHVLGVSLWGVPAEEWAFYAFEAMLVAVWSARALSRGSP